jgi:hypothetical protein
MATFTETAVRVVVELVRDGDSQTLSVTGVSMDANGVLLRTGEKRDVTAFLTQAQVAAALLILDAAEDYYKTLWSIA